jgi:hypothetical protein
MIAKAYLEQRARDNAQPGDFVRPAQRHSVSPTTPRAPLPQGAASHNYKGIAPVAALIRTSNFYDITATHWRVGQYESRVQHFALSFQVKEIAIDANGGAH